MIAPKFTRQRSWTSGDDALLLASLDSLTVDELAAKLNRTEQAVRSRINHLGRSLRRDGPLPAYQQSDAGAGYMPTSAQIEAECVKIREGWNETSLVTRIVDDRTRAIVAGESTPPVYSERDWR